MPTDKLQALGAVLGLTVEAIYREIGVLPPEGIAGGIPETSFRTERRSIRFPYIATVPDHTWPLLARDTFSSYGIELIEEPLNLSEFRIRMEDVGPDQGDTMIVIGSSWLKDKCFNRFQPVALSHLYHGYALVGRQPSTVRGINVSASQSDGPTLSNLFILLAELLYKGVIGTPGKTSIACCEERCTEFVDLLIEVAQADPATRGMLNGLPKKGGYEVLEHVSTQTFLEPLSEVGHNRFDFVVGHALTTAAAHAASGYRVLADYRNLEQVAAQLPANSDERKRVKTDLKDRIRKLQEPVVVALNVSNITSATFERFETPSRICAALNAAAETLFKTLSSTTLASLSSLLKGVVQEPIPHVHLRRAWESSYDVLTVNKAIAQIEEVPTIDGPDKEAVEAVKNAMRTAKDVMNTHLSLKAKAEEASAETDDGKKESANVLLRRGDFHGACKLLNLFSETDRLQ